MALRILLVQVVWIVVFVALHQVGLFPSLGAITAFLTGTAAGWVASLLLAIYLGALLFLTWKTEVQPRLHGFLLNPSQHKPVVDFFMRGYPRFYDTSTREFQWVGELERAAPVILDEAREMIRANGGEPGAAFKTAYDNRLLKLGGSWKTLNLMSYGQPNSPLMPRTMEVMRRVPNLFLVNLSRMAPKSRLKFHAGESTAYVRCHMGIKIPAQAPVTAMHVRDEQRSWEEGKVLAFCDGQWHGSVNGSDEERYVLIFDVMPSGLGWYTKQFCALMVAFNVTQLLLPGRLGLDEPLWHPGVFLANTLMAVAGLPMLVGFYAYFCSLDGERPKWLGRLGDAGFGFYY
ncbi:MAG: aspartyl/asparaginyl beta-hydroxylase domain-containing protein [Rhizobiaceae bacterium]|nr:aspartyl/asparaginyl beta-hydroxylase domain-containing protein [Rhizobiaceae bacterium]